MNDIDSTDLSSDDENDNIIDEIDVSAPPKGDLLSHLNGVHRLGKCVQVDTSIIFTL